MENVAPRDRKHGACALRNSEAVALTRSNKCGACPSLFLAYNVLRNNGQQTGFYILSEHLSICMVVCLVKKPSYNHTNIFRINRNLNKKQEKTAGETELIT